MYVFWQISMVAVFIFSHHNGRNDMALSEVMTQCYIVAVDRCDTLCVCVCVCLCVQDDVVSRLQPSVPFILDPAGITDNLCKVEVFYEQFDYESIEESEAYPVRPTQCSPIDTISEQWRVTSRP